MLAPLVSLPTGQRFSKLPASARRRGPAPVPPLWLEAQRSSRPSPAADPRALAAWVAQSRLQGSLIRLAAEVKP